MSANEQKKTLTKIESQVLYTDIYPDIDLEYILRGDLIKENLILKRPVSQSFFTFFYTALKMTPKIREDGTILLTGTDGEGVFLLEKPSMTDAQGEVSDAVAVSLKETDEGFSLAIEPDQNWLNDPKRVKVCFVEGTAILTATGYVAIENIQIGDMVWSENPETGEKALKRVVQTFVNETIELVHVFVNGEEIVTTPEHPFYVPRQGWTGAIHLRAGDMLVLSSGKYVTVEKIQHEILEKPTNPSITHSAVSPLKTCLKAALL